jgi:hypothetical protein
MLRVLAAAALLAGSLACTGNATERATCDPVGEGTPTPGVLRCRIDADLEIVVDGELTFQDSGTYGLIVNELFGEELPNLVWFGNLGMETFIDIDADHKYRFGFDIAPSAYRGDGTYELTAERRSVEGLESPVTDAAFLEIISLDPDELGTFTYGLEEPCRLEVTEHLTFGEIECPTLTDDRDRTISLEVSWAPAEAQER